MGDSDKLTTPSYIKTLVQADLQKLKPHLREWAEQHLVPPHQVTLFINPDGDETIILWLVTDHTGHHDASYRIVFDEEKQEFGLGMQWAEDVEWYMGTCGGFAETVRKM